MLSKALTRIKELEVEVQHAKLDVWQVKLDVEEKEKKITTLSQEYDKQAKIIENKFINETKLEKKEAGHVKALKQAFVHSMYTL
uniref:Uncharacterized protein n=1 Tax=Cannabis sativa TaxID=3483 RepID=A0A803PTP0_CANSA